MTPELKSSTSGEPAARTSSPLAWLILACSVALLLLGCWQARWVHADDAFITFRYAENVASGVGPVFNAGERVEGYSTPLYVLVLAGARVAGLELFPFSRVLGVLSVLAILAMLFEGLRRAGVDARAAALVTLLPSTCIDVHLSSVGGMETLPHAALFFGGLLLLADPEAGQRRTFAASCLLMLAALARPEGIAYWGLGFLLVLATNRRVALVYLIPLTLYLTHLAWRHAYYGDLLPNTYHAKVGRGRASLEAGLLELRRFLSDPTHDVWLALAIVGAGIGASVGGQRRRVLVFAVAIVVHGAYVVSVGGDSLDMFRFYLPILAPLAFLVGLGLGSGAGAPVWLGWLRVGVLVLLVGGLVHAGVALQRGGAAGRATSWYTGNRKLGEHLAATRDPDTLIAVSAAGAIPYFSRLPTLDLYGLNDAHIAHGPFYEGFAHTGHAKWDTRYVLEREPDIVVVNLGYLPAGPDQQARIERAKRDPISVAGVVMERQLFSFLVNSLRYEIRALDLGDGSKFLVFERVNEPS